MSDSTPDPTSTHTAEDIEKLKASLNQQTAKIDWEQLQRHYASGAIVAVAPSMDLIEVACQVSCDNKALVESWLRDALVFKVDDDLAKHWYQQNPTLWAVVVAPWVLVQEASARKP